MSTEQRLSEVFPGRLSGGDLVATLLVATSVIVSVLWLTDVALTNWSTRVAAAVVFALGYLGCVTTRSRMAEVYGAGGRHRAPLVYVIAASLVGTLALVSGVIAVLWATESMLVVLLASIVTLWAMSTARHMTTRQERRREES